MIDLRKLEAPPVRFQRLTPSQRLTFARAHRGFFASVVGALDKSGYSFSLATVNRTWYGQFKRPNAMVVADLEREYRRITAEEREPRPVSA